ncbi:MAG: DUF748 domain-containing protein [Candidatus Omnitrophica bacterium]|nr:DUF748 domain-containing protein [Candidatus Omnitrophota bacterium]MCM8790178.1 DUF748 domain-containing protein [Candidatus Omnitrophota bacterium]
MRKNNFLKKSLFTLVVIIVIVATAVFVYRYQIIQYSTEAVVRKLLPDYISVDKISFNFKDRKLSLGGLCIKNPPGFHGKYLLEVENLSCGYNMRGRHILDGIEITEPIFRGAVLDIERLADGSINLQKMQQVVEGPAKNSGAVKAQAAVADEKKGRGGGAGAAPLEATGKKIQDVVKLPEKFLARNCKALFTDHMVRPAPYRLTFENIDATLTLNFNSYYTGLLRLSSTGSGDLNGRKNENIKWNIVWDPTTARLTMSNRFDVSGVDIKAFEPYYERYSPFVFNQGKFSGVLIFDFDNGNIGSSNEIRLSRLSFSIKKGQENSQFLEVTVPDLVRYFSSSTGEVIFDFKIKGDMADPKFHLGPISKRAMTAMAVDKVSAVIAEVAKAQQQGSAAPGGESEYDKAKAIVDAFKGLVDKKK